MHHQIAREEDCEFRTVFLLFRAAAISALQAQNSNCETGDVCREHILLNERKVCEHPTRAAFVGCFQVTARNRSVDWATMF
jgi:hypothetical protein